MAIQRKIDLNQPLSGTGEAKIELTSLTPDLCEAALILQGDNYRQIQATFTKHVLWHRAVLSTVVGILASYTYWELKDYIEVAESFSDFLRLARKSGDLHTALLYNATILLVCLGFVGVCSFLVSDEFRMISDRLITTPYIDYFFGFDIKKLSKLELGTKDLKEKKLIANGANSQLISYKDEPFGIITLKTLPEKSNDANLIVKVTGISIRKAFRPLDFEQVLLDWALSRSKELLKAHLKERKITKTNGCKVSILIDNYSFDNSFAEFLKKNKFTKVSSDYNYNPTGDNTAIFKGLINTTFRSSRDTYAVHIVDKN